MFPPSPDRPPKSSVVLTQDGWPVGQNFCLWVRFSRPTGHAFSAVGTDGRSGGEREVAGRRRNPLYSINVETTNRAGEKTIIPIVARNNPTGQHDSTGFKTSDGQHLSVKHHYVDLGFCFTDYKVQGITVKKGDKLIVVLDDLPARLDIATISVCLSRVTRIEDLRIFKLDLKNKYNIKHLVRLHKNYVTGLWELGYETWNSHWDADKLKCVRQAKLRKLLKEFAMVKLGQLKMAGRDGLDAWLKLFEIPPGAMLKAEKVKKLEKFWKPRLHQTQQQTTGAGRAATGRKRRVHETSLGSLTSNRSRKHQRTAPVPRSRARTTSYPTVP